MYIIENNNGLSIVNKRKQVTIILMQDIKLGNIEICVLPFIKRDRECGKRDCIIFEYSPEMKLSPIILSKFIKGFNFTI
jgi:hypothetical protein